MIPIMKIHVGSKNQTKVEAVIKMIETSALLGGAEVIGVDVHVETFGHPRSLEEVINGAVDRAKQAFGDCQYSVGIESGLMAFPHSKTGHVEVAVCAIWDGEQLALGTAPAFEWPTHVLDGILNKGLDGSQALKAAGVTSHQKIGTAEGGIHILTNGRMSRTEQNSYAVMMALIQLEHPQHYS